MNTSGAHVPSKRKRRSDAGQVRKSEYRALKPKPRLYRCRCASYACRQRTTMAKHPQHGYKRGPKLCPCGAPYRVDWQRTLGRESRKAACECGMWHFPHRKGSCAKVAARERG